MVCLGRPYPFKFFKGCRPQILLVPLMNTLPNFSLDFPEVFPLEEKCLKILNLHGKKFGIKDLNSLCYIGNVKEWVKYRMNFLSNEIYLLGAIRNFQNRDFVG